jgi:DNA-binding MarR family transcriptional regulator
VSTDKSRLPDDPDLAILLRLAEVLDVTKQAAQQTVDDMAGAGLLTREPDPQDGRRKLLVLTAEGRRVRATALEVSGALEAEIGERGARALRAALLGMVERHGDLEHVQANRSRALWRSR